LKSAEGSPDERSEIRGRRFIPHVALRFAPLMRATRLSSSLRRQLCIRKMNGGALLRHEK